MALRPALIDPLQGITPVDQRQGINVLVQVAEPFVMQFIAHVHERDSAPFNPEKPHTMVDENDPEIQPWGRRNFHGDLPYISGPTGIDARHMLFFPVPGQEVMQPNPPTRSQAGYRVLHITMHLLKYIQAVYPHKIE